MIKNLLNRTTTRKFRETNVPEEHFKIIEDIINASPTSTNMHHFSAIIVRDQKTKEMIADANFGQDHIRNSAAVIVFVADRYRFDVVKEKFNIKIDDPDYSYHEYIRTILDSSIASALTMDALIELGYGVGYVGGFPTNGREFEKILNLPKSSFAILGITFGLPLRKDRPKPKLKKVFYEKYDLEKSKNEILDFNERTKSFYKGFQSESHFEFMKRQMDPQRHMYQNFKDAGKYLKSKIKDIE